jgi:inorganic phosphate transporter, PiT family
MDIFSGMNFINVIFLVLALLLALSFEFVNGFHDTANAVATVIYTNSLKPTQAVVWSGFWNLLGVMLSSGAVAYSIISLLPVELVLNSGSSRGFAMVFSLLIAAIIWNLGTWYFGIPASSSHTLIGSIMGVGIANSLLTPGQSFGEGVNWSKVSEVFASLLISPLVGFVLSALLLIIAKQILTKPELYKSPEPGVAPPSWIRALLIATCTGVSFAHGSNDGQKGMGLMMLILIGVLPGIFALNMFVDPGTINNIVVHSQNAAALIDKQTGVPGNTLTNEFARDKISAFLKNNSTIDPKEVLPAISHELSSITSQLKGKTSFNQVDKDKRGQLRTDFYLASGAINKLHKLHKIPTELELEDTLLQHQLELDGVTKYIPNWVKTLVAVALGLGTMIGWKRIVVTVGEKIGKDHLSYGQGAAAELVAMSTIFAADHLGLPVSTTHVLSSGVAGTMTANGSGLQSDTVKSILLAWVLTLPVCIFLGAALFAASSYFFTNALGMG